MIRLDTNTDNNYLFRKVAIVVEFVGSPGAGKTTSCQHFSEVLKKKNLKVCLSQDIKVYVRQLNMLKKLFLFSETLLLKGHLLLLYPIALAFNNAVSLHAVYRYFRLAIFNQALPKLVRLQAFDIVLLDQWAIQELWSATIFNLHAFNNLNHLSKFYLNPDLVFYLDVNEAIASDRISKRNTNLSRFDNMPPEKRLTELSKYKTHLYQLYQRSDCRHKFVLSAEETLNQNAKHFYKQLKLFPGTKQKTSNPKRKR